MFKFLRRFLLPESGSSPSRNPDPDFRPHLVDVPRYPPFDEGLPSVPVERILETQTQLALRICASTDSRLAREAIERFANFVHLLPATKERHHSGAGGLFRLGLEVGFYSLQAAEGHTFASRDPLEVRNQNEEKWRLAALLAGLCIEAYRSVSGVTVTDSSGAQWTPLTTPLGAWLKERGTDRYFLRWVEHSQERWTHSAQAVSTLLVNHIIPPAAFEYLASQGQSVLVAMMATVSGSATAGRSNALSRMVEAVRLRVIDRDLQTHPSSFGRPQVGLHLEPHVIGAMRALVEDGIWRVNEPKARMWVARDGAYIFWKTGLPEIIEHLRRQRVVGIPNDPTTIAQWMVDSEVFESSGDGSPFWMIRLPDEGGDWETVKLRNVEILLDPQRLESLQPLDRDLAPSVSNSTTSVTVAAPKMPDLVEPNADSLPDTRIPSHDEAPLAVPSPVLPTEPVKAGAPSSPSPARARTQQGASRSVRPAFVSEINNHEDPDWPDTVRFTLASIQEAISRGDLPALHRDPAGLCLPVQYILDRGTKLSEVALALHARNALYTHPETQKRKHKVTLSGVETDCLIIPLTAAVALGFPA